MKKIVMGSMIVYVALIGILAFVWSRKPHMTNEKYKEISVYYMPEENCYSYKDILDYIVKDDDVEEVSDLETHSELIVKARLKDRKFVGNGVINVCDVQSVYKGEYVEKTILIYDFVPFWSIVTDYFEGAIPLHEGEDYVMFLNTAPNPNYEDTYIFTSIKYGHFRLKDTVAYYTYNLDDPISVQALSYYDYTGIDDRKLETFKELQKKIYSKYK